MLYLLALFLARKRGRMTTEVTRTHLNFLAELPRQIEKFLPSWDAQASGCARAFQQASKFMFLGRGVHYAIAREGALKLKEISYVQAEGLPAGELRHGSNALVDENLVGHGARHARRRRSRLRPSLPKNRLSPRIRQKPRRKIHRHRHRRRSRSRLRCRSHHVRPAGHRAAPANPGSSPAAAFRLSLRRPQRLRCGPTQKSSKIRNHRMKPRSFSGGAFKFVAAPVFVAPASRRLFCFALEFAFACEFVAAGSGPSNRAAVSPKDQWLTNPPNQP